MAEKPSLLDELRTEYEAARQVSPAHADVEGFQQIDARMRKAFRWLEKAIAYLDGLKPAINHRFDLGHGMLGTRLVRTAAGIVYFHHKGVFDELPSEGPTRFARESAEAPANQ